MLILLIALCGLQCSKSPGLNKNEQVDAKKILFPTDASKLTATNMGRPVNSPEGEFNPEMTRGGLEMFFSSERAGSQDRDLYRARRETPDGPWTTVENLGPKINSPHLDSGPSITADGKTLVFHSERLFNGADDGIQQHRDLFMVKRASIDAPFGKVRLVPGKEIITGYVDTAALITDEGKTMYFSSNRPGGIGSKDIYIATRDDPSGPFMKVVNIRRLSIPSLRLPMMDSRSFFIRSDRASVDRICMSPIESRKTHRGDRHGTWGSRPTPTTPRPTPAFRPTGKYCSFAPIARARSASRICGRCQSNRSGFKRSSAGADPSYSVPNVPEIP